LKAQLDLFEQGFIILNPVTEHAPFDLVAYRDGEFVRIQVEYKSVDKHGARTVHFRSTWADKHGTNMCRANKQEIDLYGVYCPDTDACYYFDPKQFNRSVTLRVEASKNNQTQNVRFAADFHRVP
jgi:hypothetical protein